MEMTREWLLFRIEEVLGNFLVSAGKVILVAVAIVIAVLALIFLAAIGGAYDDLLGPVRYE